MGPLDAIWHLLNFVAPAAGVALFAAAAVKMLWRRELRSVRWQRLAGSAAGVGALALAVGLLVFGRDGRIATYALLIGAAAAALWWAGFGPGRR